MNRIIILFFLVVISPALRAQQALYHRVKVHTGAQGLLQMAAEGIAVDHGISKKGHFFISDFSEQELQKIQALGLPYEIQINDVGRYYRERNKNAGKPTANDFCANCPDYATPENFRLGSMGGFYTFAELLDELDSMKLHFPHLISSRQPISVYTTAEGNPLYYVKISNNPDTDEAEPEVLYTALHHAREPQSLSQLIFYMWYLLENYNTDEEIRYLVDNRELYFIPCVNPDGYIYNQSTSPGGGGMWRKNRRNNGDGSRGVDLNRNYGWLWGFDNAGSSPQTFSDVYRGSQPFSEIETRMIRDFCNSREFTLALNAHTFSNLLIYPFGHMPDVLTPDSVAYRQMAGAMTDCSGFMSGTAAETVGYPTNGDSDAWMYAEQNSKPKILAFTPEAGHGEDGFWPLTNRIIPIAKQTMDQNLDAARMAGVYAQLAHTDAPFVESMESYIHFNLERRGRKPGPITVSVIPLTANIDGVGNPKNFAIVPPGITLSDSIRLSLNGEVLNHTFIKYILRWEAADGHTVSDTITRYFGIPHIAFYSNCDNLDSFVTTGWGRHTDTFVTATGSLTDSPDGNYAPLSHETITTASAIDLRDAGHAYLSYYARWDIEKSYDQVELMISTDGGNTFYPVCTRYTHPGTEYQSNSIAVYDGYSDWIKETIDLSDYLGHQIFIRFALSSDPAVEADGFYFDEFVVYTMDAVNAIRAPRSAVMHLSNTPNPASGYTRISFDLRSFPGSSLLQITDITGKMVWQQSIQHQQTYTDVQVAGWPSGVYMYRILNGNVRSVAKKLVVLH